MLRARRLDRLEKPHGDNHVEWPNVFFYPDSGTPERQAAFTRDIERRRQARQFCAVVGGPGGYPTEDAAWMAVTECFV